MFGKKKRPSGSGEKIYQKDTEKPVLRCSICTGEQVAGFQNIKTGVFQEIRLIRNEKELDAFKKEYGITGEIEKIY